MISGVVFVSIIAAFILYLLLGRSQSVNELRTIILNSISTHRIKDYFAPSPQFVATPKKETVKLEASLHFYPQIPGDFVDTFRPNPVLLEENNFRVSKSIFFKSPIEKVDKEVPKKDSDEIEMQNNFEWNPPLTPFSIQYRPIAPGTSNLDQSANINPNKFPNNFSTPKKQ